MVSFVHLHAHTHYSVRDAAMTVQQYVQTVKSLGMTACALTEHGNMHSALEFYNACKKEGVKPIIGVEAYILPYREMATSDDLATRRTKHHLVLLAKDEIGYRQLCKAVTASYLLQEKSGVGVFPRMTYGDLASHFVGGHVIALSGCVLGEVATVCLAEGYEKAKEKALLYQSIFGDGNFYLEIQNHGLANEVAVFPQLIQLSRETKIPLVATNDCHYARREDAALRDIMVAQRFKGRVTDPSFEPDCQELYVKSPEEMCDLFGDVPEALANTSRIAKQCELSLAKDKHFPRFKTPDGKSEDDYLRELAYSGLYRRHPGFDTMPEAWKKERLDRIEYELDVIKKTKYAGYLLIVADFVSYGRKVGLVGLGRGSAVGSYVCYLLGIVDVDPLKYGLLFERFLNLDRVSDPDIDTDFDDTRGDVLQYVRRVYGENAVCHIIAFGTLGARSAIRFVGRATGVPDAFCDKLAKLVPSRPNITLKEALNEVPELKAEYDGNATARRLLETAARMEGLIDKTSVHAAGVIIGDRDLSDYMPLMYDEEKQEWVSQFDMDYCQKDCGLLKMDFLGLANLTIIKNTLRDIERNHGKKITLYDIPYDDRDVIREIFAKGRTKGVFQFESSGMVNLLKRFQPSSIEDLILLNAAFRPGPLQYLDEIIDVKHGKKKPRYICNGMAEILDVTYGKPIYQEQIMAIFNRIAGFSLGVGDIIRRAMAKKHEEELKQYLPDFKKGLVNAGASPEDAEKFCEEVIEFSNYAFNKSHAAAYAVTAYITAYLKYYYPVEYMANLLNVASIDDIPLYIKEARDMGIPILPPSVNESGEFFTPTKAGAIRFGLGRIKGLGKACRDTIAEREASGAFKSFSDFVERMVKSDRALNKKMVVALAQTGAFDEFGVARRQVAEACADYLDVVREFCKRETELADAKRRFAEFTFPCVSLRFETSGWNVKGLPKDVRETLVAEESANGSFADLRDLLERLKRNGIYCSKKSLLALLKSGLFEFAGASEDIASVSEEYIRLLRDLARKEKSFQAAKAAFETYAFPQTGEYERRELLRLERELLGFYASGHPLLDFQELLAEKADFNIAELDSSMDGEYVTLCGQVTNLAILRRREDGVPMCKFVLEDLSGQVETIVFTKAFGQYKDNIADGAVVWLRGRVRAGAVDDGVDQKIEIQATEVQSLTKSLQKVFIKVPSRNEWGKAKEILEKYRGPSELLVYIGAEGTLLKTKLGVSACRDLIAEYESVFGAGSVVMR